MYLEEVTKVCSQSPLDEQLKREKSFIKKVEKKKQLFSVLPSFIPPHCLEPLGLQGGHDDVHVVVAISQHALLVRRH